MKLWLDDLRPMPKGFDVHAKTVEQALDLLASEQFDFISFDHDLGTDSNGNLHLTGYDLAKIIEKKAFEGKMKPLGWAIHSANPVGRQNIERAMQNAERFWNLTPLNPSSCTNPG